MAKGARLRTVKAIEMSCWSERRGRGRGRLFRPLKGWREESLLAVGLDPPPDDDDSELEGL
jgi:hypothetical protein